MEWGMIVTAVALVAMFALQVEEVEVETPGDTVNIPDYEPEYESLAIDVADYQFAV